MRLLGAEALDLVLSHGVDEADVRCARQRFECHFSTSAAASTLVRAYEDLSAPIRREASEQLQVAKTQP